VAAFPSYLSFGGGGRGEELQFALKGPDLNGVARWAEVLKTELDKRPNLGNVDLVLEIQLPQVSLEINRELAAEMGLSAMSVAQAANVLAGGIDVAKFNDEPGDGQRYDVRLKAAGDVSVADLSKIYLRAAGGELVRLDTVARFEESVGPAVVSRHDRRYAANFYTDPNVSLSLAIEEAKAAAEGILPPGYELYMQGRAREFARLTSSMVFAFSISLIMVYMVLASQFNSFIQPLIIMIAQPLAIIGGVIALWMTASSMNVFSMTGLVLLMGLVAKNSILLVDLTNQFRDQGMSVDEALKAAGPRRLRPILMTSFTIVLAMMVPMAGVGTGVELSQPLAFAVVGGMISSTGLTLIVVPAAYSLVERRREEKLARAQLEQGTAARGSV
jgi:HAE1 family hydrophobic/amphiphilic exporter-1